MIETTKPVSAPQHPDNDPTDELPVLSDVALAEFEAQTAQSTADTGEHTVQMPGPEPDAFGDDSERVPLGALERDVAELTTRWSRLEAQFAESAAAVGALTEQLASAQRALGESTARRQRLGRELEDKNRRLTLLDDQCRQLRQDNTALREAVDRFAADKESLSAQLAVALEDSGARAELDTQRAQQQALEAELAQARTRVAELERGREAELEQAQARIAEAERSREAQVEQARARIRELEDELTAAEQLIEELAPAEQMQGTDADVEAYRAEIAALSDYITNRRSYWDEMEASLASQRERIAELEAEVEHRSERQQAAEKTARHEAALAAEFKERLSDTAQRLEAARAESAAREPERNGAERQAEALEKQLRAARSELEARDQALKDAQTEAAESRERLAVLEEELAAARADRENARAQLQALEARADDHDQETELHKERVARLQRELTEQLEGLRGLDDAPQARAEPAVTAEHAAAANGADMGALLVCLTSEQPQEYALAKPVMTIGRSDECDIQIPTHFVSREHARLLAGPDGIAIEDLGSTNGVFVNSVRVEHQALQHGDWITIGETQFRFLSGERS